MDPDELFDPELKSESESEFESEFDPELEPEREKETISGARLALVGLIFSLAIVRLYYELLASRDILQSAALFMGLPLVLAVGLTLFARPRSAVGMAVLGTTIVLLTSALVFREGFICVFMAAPILYAVAIGASLLLDAMRPKDGWRGGRGFWGFAFLPLVLLSLEGTDHRLSLPRGEVVTVDRVVAAGAARVEQALATPPSFGKPLPFYLRLGFPKPVRAEGAGLRVGDRRVVWLEDGGRLGHVDLVIEAVEPGHVRFRLVKNTTMVAQWLELQATEVRWEEVESGKTRVRWTMQYERSLDPFWYFGPWERYGVGLAAGYLIDTVATP